MKTVHLENAPNNIEDGMNKKTCIKCSVFECDKFLVHLMLNQIVKSDLRKVRNLHICKMTLTCSKYHGDNIRYMIFKILHVFQEKSLRLENENIHSHFNPKEIVLIKKFSNDRNLGVKSHAKSIKSAESFLDVSSSVAVSKLAPPYYIE